MYKKKNISFTEDDHFLYDFLESKGNASKYIKKLLRKQFYIEKGMAGLMEDELGSLEQPMADEKNQGSYDSLDKNMFKKKTKESIDEENKKLARGIPL